MDANKDSKPEMEGNASLMSDQIVEKLKLLDYENLFTKVKGHHPLTKTYFVTKSPNAGEQNVYFIALSSWLVNLCGGKISGDKKYDDPVTMANNLLTEMKNIGIDCSIPPNQLRAGYGVPICTVLLLLVNKALEKKGFAFKRPKFDDQGKVNTREAPEIIAYGIKNCEHVGAAVVAMFNRVCCIIAQRAIIVQQLSEHP